MKYMNCLNLFDIVHVLWAMRGGRFKSYSWRSVKFWGLSLNQVTASKNIHLKNAQFMYSNNVIQAFT